MKPVYFVTNEQLSVMNVAGSCGNTTPPAETHQWGWFSREKAEAAAEAMAKKHGGQKFFVAKILAIAEPATPPVKLTRVEE